MFFTTVVYDEVGEAAAAVFLRKVPALRILRPGSRWVEIDPRLGRLPSEPVIAKAGASAFFGVPFAAMLAGRDTLIVCGASTSGCVRATVVDAMQHGLAPIVPRECVGDRSPRAHEQALDDISGRYGDVVCASGKLPARWSSPGSALPIVSPSHSATLIRASRSMPVSTPSFSSR